MAEKGGDSSKDVLVTGKKTAEEDLQEAEGDRQAQRIDGAGDHEVMDPGPKLGSGPRWRLRAGTGAAEAEEEGDGALFRCGAMLDQALSCSGIADVRFLFDDGRSLVSGHRGMLCSVSSEFVGMFESGMMEAKTGEVRVRGVSRESFRGFLELLYLGRAGKEVGLADGREVWVLADLYDVKGIKEWLLRDGLEEGSVCGAVQYALEGEGFLDELLEACKKRVSSLGELHRIEEGSLRGVSAEAARALLEEYLNRARRTDDCYTGMLAEGFKYIARWAKVNGDLVCENEDVDSLVALIDLGRMQYDDLVNIVGPSGLVRKAQFDELLFETGKEQVLSNGLSWFWDEWLRGMSAEHAGALIKAFLEREEKVDAFRFHQVVVFIVRWAKMNGDLDRGNEDVYSLVGLIDLGRMQFKDLIRLERPLQLVDEARIDAELEQRLRGRRLEGRRDVAILRATLKTYRPRYDPLSERKVNDDWYCECVAVSRQGGGHRVAALSSSCVYVIDVESGERVMTLEGDGARMLNRTGGLVYNDQGELIVSDEIQNTIFVFDRLGQVVRVFGGRGEGEGMLCRPAGVAVNGQGDIIVCDSGNHRVQIFRRDGTFVRSFGKRGREGGDFKDPVDVAVGPDGKLVVADRGNCCVQVFEPDGSHVMRIGSRGVGPGMFRYPRRVAVTSHGRILVLDYGRQYFEKVNWYDRGLDCFGFQIFSREGAFLGFIGDRGVLDGLNLGAYVVSVDEDSDGHVLVYEDDELLMIG